MPTNTFISVYVRDEIENLLARCRQRSGKLTLSKAVKEIRNRFPDLAVSDNDLIAGIMSAAIATDVAVEMDAPEADSSGRLDRWDNEGGAIKNKPPETEAREAKGSSAQRN